MRRCFALLITSMIVLMGQVSAQDNSWSAWFYDSDAGRAWQVDNNGIVLHDVQLRALAIYAPNSFAFSRGLAVSHDGTRLAYSITGQDAVGSSMTTFTVYDVPTGRVLITYEPPMTPTADALSLARQANLFNLTGGAVAYSYAAGETAETQVWQIVVIDLLTGTTLAELSNTHSALQAQNLDTTIAPFVVPQIYYYEGATVNFALVAFGNMAVNQQFANFAWDAITGRVVQTNQFSTFGGDYLPRIGESVIPIVDERIAYDAVYAPYANALHVYRPDVGARSPFFGSATLDLLRADFVENGNRLIVQAQSLADASFVWLLVDRLGVSRVIPTINAIENEIIGTRNGFVYILTGTPPIAILTDTTTAQNDQTPLWVAPTDAHVVPVWSTAPDRETARSPWVQLAPPVFTAQIIIVPDSSSGVTASEVSTTSPSGRGILTVNGVAIISTTEGDRLNMRNQPRLSATIAARLDNGTQVVLLDGPVAGDGFTWWQVRLNTGLTGWVVESADGVRTLIPAG
ncbi:MAG: SH3 domain-containing protein [Anaerolineae bacterium]|nr:SH3 domain-containing protein [Anaerolineae bacterium]